MGVRQPEFGVVRASPPASRNALTLRCTDTYHGEMRQRLRIAAGTPFFAAGLLGCEGAGERPVQAPVPALSPQTTTQQAPLEMARLPAVKPPHRYSDPLL